ncbi:10689_t:CDS:2 [Gigaspora margarita]|uniref:10689_t:CDS:1 n=1 Tax=Gigaspora margarita TaxID=4874 RepID=A0ABN7UVC5_GIGMA|nr:10689_t:CDS:2 [Gigaspora margarita]
MTEGCKAALVSFVTDKNISKCLPPNDLLVLLNAFESSNPTVAFAALIQFASTVCPLDRCSDDVISKGKESIKKACLAEDIQKNHNPVALVGVLGTTLYSPIIESLCFTVGTTAPTFCFADSVSKLLPLPAPPFPPVFGKFIDNVAFGTPTAFCTDCNHRISLEVFNYIFDPNHHDTIETLGLLNVTEAELTQLKLGTMIKCGFTFLTSNDTFPGVCSQTNSSSSLGKSSKFIGDKKSKKKTI